MRNTTRIWLHGLIAAFIGGGSSAVTAGAAAMGIDPNTFNFSTGLGKIFKLIGLVFLMAGAMSAFGYLKNFPLPPENGDSKPTEEEKK